MNTITYIQVLGGCGTPYPHVKVYHTIGMWWWKQRCVSILYKKEAHWYYTSDHSRLYNLDVERKIDASIRKRQYEEVKQTA